MDTFVDLDINDKISESLRGKTVLEFPTIKIDKWAGGAAPPSEETLEVTVKTEATPETETTSESKSTPETS